MNSKKNSRILLAIICSAIVTFSLAVCAHAQTLTPIFTFTGASTGERSSSGLIFDNAGNLYGLFDSGGSICSDFSFGCGGVFELSPNSGGGWTETVIYEFQGSPDGAFPVGSLIFDAAGNLYGAAAYGGNTSSPCDVDAGCGVIFRLAPNGDGTWTESVLYTFTGGVDGSTPVGPVTFDASSNLFGAALEGGTHRCNNGQNCGVVFELSPTASGPWNQTVLHNFTGNVDGQNPNGGMIFDASGNLYGTTQSGGVSFGCVHCGVAFKLSQHASGWGEAIIHKFTGDRDGGFPLGQLLMDSTGNIYGTAGAGGNPNCSIPENKNICGLVYKLAPNSNGSWKETTFDFGFWDGAQPSAGLAMDAAGNLYAAANIGGISDCGSGYGCGTIVKLTPNATGWTPTVLHRFANAADGGDPVAGPILDAAGNLYGTASSGGGYSYGDVWEIVPLRNPLVQQ